jgi:hypothetical protein
MDRSIIYTQEQIRGYDISKGWQDSFKAIGQEASDILGQTGAVSPITVVSGFAGTQSSPASLTINIAAGSIYFLGTLDPNPEGDLPADGTTWYMQGINHSSQTLTLSTSALTSGQSQWALVEATFAFNDVVRSGDPSGGVLPFYNSANPSVPLQGQGGSGAVLNTEHQAIPSFQVKYGSPATTGSQVPPSADTGYVGLYLILLTYGQTTITTAEILTAGPSVGTGVPSNYPYAPFLAGLLNSHHDGNPGQAPQIKLTSEVQGILPVANLPISSGSFTATLTGMSGTTTGTVYYSIGVNGLVTLTVNNTGISGTSSTDAMTMTGLPSAIYPAYNREVPTFVVNNGVDSPGTAGIASSGTITFTVAVVSGSAVQNSGTGFVTSGTKGLNTSWTLIYPL